MSIEFDSCNNGTFFIACEDGYDDILEMNRSFKCGFIDNCKTDYDEVVFYQDDDCNVLNIEDMEMILSKMKELKNDNT